jgi:uncharacterized protein YfdQ (DUF2303 family)
MFTKEALEFLAESDAISAAGNQLQSALKTNTPTIALPDSLQLHSIEHLLPHRMRMRGRFATTSLASFANYITTNKEAESTIFVNPFELEAEAILDFGNPTTPGHAQNVAAYKPQKMAEYLAVLAACKVQLTQRAIAEFLEDWRDNIACLDAAGQAIEPNHAISAVRDLTIEASKKVGTVEQNLNASRSSLESVTAKGTLHALPSQINFTCKPYADLKDRRFELRLSVLTSETKPTFSLHIKKAEHHQAEMQLELQSLIAGQNTGLTVQIGTYKTT